MGSDPHPDGVLTTRAREAPSGPGVYVLLGRDDELLYVGKGTDVRRRLLDHAKVASVVSRVRDVRWIDCANEFSALCLEADVIVGLAPTMNKTMAHDEFTYLCVDAEPDRVRLRLSGDRARTKASKTFGAFPHLGKGKSSWRAVRTNGGYSSLLRLMWIAFSDTRLPSRLRGSSPPTDHRAPFVPTYLPHLHDFLSGRSPRLLATLRAAIPKADDYMRGPLERDADAAEGFYRLGPQALRDLRRAHRLRRGPVDPEAFAAAVAADLTAAIGPFRTTRAMMGVS